MTTIADGITTLITPTVGNGAAASSRAAPGAASSWLDTKAAAPNNFDGGTVGVSVQNGSAPGVPGTILVQWSPDNGVTIYDVGGIAGDLIANSFYSASIDISPSMRYIRVIGFGNTTNAVTFGATYSGTTRS